MKRKRIKYQDRLIIAEELRAGQRIADIAEKIGVSAAAIYQELKRGSDAPVKARTYDPERAQRQVC